MPQIEYFYAAYSAYAYLGHAKLVEIAAAAGAEIVHRPIDLRRVVPASGATDFAKRTPAHRAYFFGREIARWGEERGVPVLSHTPTHHGNDITLSNCLLIAAMESGNDVNGLAHAILEAHWRFDADHNDRATLQRLAEGQGLDGVALLAKAETAPVKALYEQYTADAIARSVFGSPTYFVDGDMFYGQDRLEQVARALRQPYQR